MCAYINIYIYIHLSLSLNIVMLGLDQCVGSAKWSGSRAPQHQQLRSELWVPGYLRILVGQNRTALKNHTSIHNIWPYYPPYELLLTCKNSGPLLQRHCLVHDALLANSHGHVHHFLPGKRPTKGARKLPNDWAHNPET